MKISLFLSSMLESLWSMAMSFVIGSSSSPRAYKLILQFSTGYQSVRLIWKIISS